MDDRVGSVTLSDVKNCFDVSCQLSVNLVMVRSSRYL